MEGKDPPKKMPTLQEMLELKIAILKQKSLNEALQLQSDIRLQEIIIKKHVLSAREDCMKEMNKAKVTYDQVSTRLIEMGKIMRRVHDFVRSDRFIRIKAMIKAQNELEQQQKIDKENEKDKRMINWYKEQVEMFNKLPIFAKKEEKKRLMEELATKKAARLRKLLAIACINCKKQNSAVKRPLKPENTDYDSDTDTEDAETSDNNSFSINMNLKASLTTAFKKRHRTSESLKRHFSDSSSDEEEGYRPAKRPRFSALRSLNLDAPSTSKKSAQKPPVVPQKPKTPQPLPKKPIEKHVFKVPGTPPLRKTISKKKKPKPVVKIKKLGCILNPRLLHIIRSTNPKRDMYGKVKKRAPPVFDDNGFGVTPPKVAYLQPKKPKRYPVQPLQPRIILNRVPLITEEELKRPIYRPSPPPPSPPMENKEIEDMYPSLSSLEDTDSNSDGEVLVEPYSSSDDELDENGKRMSDVFF